MSRSNWLPSPPAGTLILIFLSLLAVGLANHQQHPHHSDYAASQKYEVSKKVEPMGSSTRGHYSEPKAYREEWRAEQDLKAQRDMSKWALLTMIFTGVGVILLTATLFSTAQATKAAIGAVDEARKTNAVAQESMERQLRAYLEVKDSQVKNFLLGNSPVVEVELINCGHTPARKIKAIFAFHYEGPDNPQGKIRFREHTSERPPEGSIAGGAGNTMTNESNPHITPKILEAVKQGKVTAFISGIVRYTDIFGKTRRTIFRHYVDANMKSVPLGMYTRVASRGNRSS